MLDDPLLATLGEDHCVHLWEAETGHLLARTRALQGIQFACLMDSLLLAICPDRVEVVHLTPLLTGDACRFDRNSKLALQGPLHSKVACRGQLAAWVSGPQLLAMEARPQGLCQLWRRPAASEVRSLVWNHDGLWVLQKNRLLCFKSSDGSPLGEWELPFDALDLKAVDSYLLIGGERGELFKIVNQQGHWLRPADGKACFALSVSPQLAALSRGRDLLFVDLHTARSRTLELPQPCVLPLLLQQDWAILTSSEGMLYQVDLQGGLARIREARRPFTSFEPTTTAPVLIRDKVLMAGPDGQLAAWALN